MNLSEVVTVMDGIIHESMGTITTKIQTLASDLESSDANLKNSLSELTVLLNALNDVAPRVFILYPHLGALVNVLKEVSQPNAPINLGTLYTALKTFLTPSAPATPVIPEVTNAPSE